MACEELKAQYDALEAQIAQLKAQLAGEPTSEQGPGLAQLKALSGHAWAVGQQYLACVAASTPAAPSMLMPQNILTTNYAMPAFDTSSPTWAKDLVGGNTFLSFPPSSPYEWTQVLEVFDDYETQFVGLSGWVIVPDISGADNPFLHPFGTDWEFYIAPDLPYQPLAAPTTGSLYVYAAQLAADRGIPVPACLGVEIEQSLVPEPWRVQDYDRVCVWGRWIVDAGHSDFHTEIHPPAVLVGARLVYPSATGAPTDEAATFSTIIGRPYLVGQTFSDGHALEAHLIEEVAKLKGFLSTRLEAHPTILPKPFQGVHLMIYSLQAPTGRINPLDRLMVSLELTVRTGVSIQVVNAGDAVTVYVGMNDIHYTAPLLPDKTEVAITRSTLKQLDPDAASAYDEVIFATILTPGNPLAPVFETNGVLTDTYAAPTPPFDRAPTILDVTALPENTPVVVDDTQPFPIIGRITLTWDRQPPATVSAVNGNASDGALTVMDTPTSAQRPYAFIRFTDGNLWVQWWSDTQWAWSNQGIPSGVNIGSPEGVITVMDSPTSAQRPYAFVQGSDGNLWVNWWTGSQWYWANQGKPAGVSISASNGAITVMDSPASAQRPYAFVLGNDGNLWVNWWTGSQWYWANQGKPAGVNVSGPGGTVTVMDTPTSAQRPYAFVRGSDGNLWVNWWSDTQWAWSNQGKPNGVSISDRIGAVTVMDSPASAQRPYAFVQGSDGNLWVNWWDGSHWYWANQGKPEGVNVAGRVGVITVMDSPTSAQRPYAFVQGSDGNLWVNWWNGSQWYWANQGKPATAAITAPVGVITVMDSPTSAQRPYAFVQGSDGNLWVNWWSGSQWIWANLGHP